MGLLHLGAQTKPFRLWPVGEERSYSPRSSRAPCLLGIPACPLARAPFDRTALTWCVRPPDARQRPSFIRHVRDKTSLRGYSQRSLEKNMKVVSRERPPAPTFYYMAGYQGLRSDKQRMRGRTGVRLEPSGSLTPARLLTGHPRPEWRGKRVSGLFIFLAFRL